MTAALLARALAIVSCASLGACVAAVPLSKPAPSLAASCAAGAQTMTRVELIFAAPAPQPGQTSDALLAGFLEREVTPRFPDGLTMFDAYGQWRRPEGAVVRIPSKVLVIWYAPSPEASARIDEIREAYKRAFDQISVMRVDGADCVSF